MKLRRLGWLLLTLLLASAAHAEAAPKCEGLNGMRVAAHSIGLPTSGARVETVIEKSGGGEAYCLVSGEIMPVDRDASSIRFELALPSKWNTKAAMLGGAGLDGVVPHVAGNVLNSTPDARTPLARGYAVFGSDSGHVIQMSGAGFSVGHDDGRFMLSAEAYSNYLGDAVKKTRDVAVAIITAAYGRGPTRSYFLGSSKGGAEGLVAAARWPADWDGVVALYPARNSTVLHLGTVVVAQALASPNAFINLAKRRTLYQAVLEQCDGLDGVRDGVVSDTRGCNARFDPATAKLRGIPLRCAGGLDNGDECLSDAQIAALRVANQPVVFSSIFGQRVQVFPGFNIFTADMGGSTLSPSEAHVADLTIGRTAPSVPFDEGNSLRVKFTDNFMRFAVARDPKFSYLAFDVSNPGVLRVRLSELMEMEQRDVDLSAFAARRGKLLIMHGDGDLMISPRSTEQYYRALVARLGQPRVDGMLRYYTVPGFGHAFSTVFNVGWDQLTALENWVERDIDPAHNQTVVDLTGVPGRTRPLCQYPTWPMYSGAGDVNAADSFSCVSDGPERR